MTNLNSSTATETAESQHGYISDKKRYLDRLKRIEARPAVPPDGRGGGSRRTIPCVHPRSRARADAMQEDDRRRSDLPGLIYMQGLCGVRATHLLRPADPHARDYRPMP